MEVCGLRKDTWALTPIEEFWAEGGFEGRWSLPYKGRDFLSKGCKCADCSESLGWERPWE